MSFAQDLTISAQEWDEVSLPLSDLLSDEPPLETDLHLRQMMLLIQCLDWWWRDRQDFYVAGNLTVYYSPRQRKSEHFRGPDFFVVLDTERRSRSSWVVWQEDGKYPNIIVELLSSSTADTDRGLKKQIYQDTFRTPEYFWFDPGSLEFQGFELVRGKYEPLQPDPQGRLWSQQLELYLGLHESSLRFFTSTGELVLTPAETAISTEQQLISTEQQVTDLQALLTRYRQQFGELPNA